MVLECKVPFGNFKPGDLVEVPDGAVFDESYFQRETAAEPATEGGAE